MINSFLKSHLGNTNQDDINFMLNKIGVENMDELMNQTIPNDIFLDQELNLPKGISENEYLKRLEKISEKNILFQNYIGLGYNKSITPSVIKRNILENPGWYTAYTPYQAEIAQGRLEALFNFQTVITDLTGMKIANASLLDESTAAAEGMSLLFNIRSNEQKKNNISKFFVSNKVLPQTIDLLKTRAEPIGINIIVDCENDFNYTNDFFGALFQYPGKHGEIINLPQHVEKTTALNIKTMVAADLLSLTLLEAPGKFGVDVVVGTSQRFGIPLGYGGPHAAFFATKEEYKRYIPGRIIGQTIDMDNNPAFRMALQTREQHIKRDRATSNICTAQVLLAVMASMYAVFHGPKGLKMIAWEIHEKAKKLDLILNHFGIEQLNENFFDTLKIRIPAQEIRKIAEKNFINFLYINESTISISLNEGVDENDLNKIINVFETFINKKVGKKSYTSNSSKLPENQLRKSDFLSNVTFNSYHSETTLMRYIKSLEQKDLSLTHSMIPLGSCTMKLNSASEMLPISSSKWADIHPFAPLNQVEGYTQILSELSNQLNIITGFSATSLQPNSGAQGEYAGLMIIRAFHESNNDFNRKICLIPASAHGTNPASAVMAGMKVIVIKTDEKGNIDWEDLKLKTNQYKDQLSALMITYPSTHGVFESNIKEITNLIHDNGGQVYMDGANMNAQVGITSPAKIGADVCHLNLHKTFAIPHGGGGPGVGPVCVAEHLSEFLPSNPVIKTGGKNGIRAISAAPWGSALACIISYGYIKMLGKDGLKKSTQNAILNANYIKSRLEGAYKILYLGENGRTAHELIIDLRPFKKFGVEVIDVAKRLMDYGFHAPTVSFPVSGTMMIEPTESENIKEIDRFCDALISIRLEVESCNSHDEKSILKNAPHTLKMATDDHWQYEYSRSKAIYPLEYVKENKFWPSVRRVDEAFGDRNLVCSCSSIIEFIKV
tara:strand:+ start:375 stop:3224 length:2850 start_codon:yes stop_codon:yes gene_type:complete